LTIHADGDLARRLEAIISAEWRRLAEIGREMWPEKRATCLDVADGVALWLGEGSPVNVAVGLGMECPVEEADLRQVEDFYSRRGAAAILTTCPFAHPSLFTLLAKRGWRITEFENVLTLALDELARLSSGEEAQASGSGGEAHASRVGSKLDAPDAGRKASLARPADPAPRIEVRTCTPPERELWGHVAARGFADDDAGRAIAQEEFGSLMAARRDTILVLGWMDGQPVGTGALGIDGDVGWLMGDSTLSGYRRRGVQQAIQRYRLDLARDAGCALAVTEAAPGSGSQRNMERLGFRVAYTHLEFTKN
jgi:GNAT superfamily N-acetyltransferase